MVILILKDIRWNPGMIRVIRHRLHSIIRTILVLVMRRHGGGVMTGWWRVRVIDRYFAMIMVVPIVIVSGMGRMRGNGDFVNGIGGGIEV